MRQNQISVRLRILFMVFVILASTVLLPTINIQAATKSTKSSKQTSSKDLEITLGDKTYTVTENIKKTDVPKDFSKSEVEYNGKQYSGLKFDEGDVNLLYLVSEDDKTSGTFYMVDSESNTLSPYIKVSGNQSYIILLNPPSKAKVPEGYKATKLTLDGSSSLTVYHYDQTDSSENTSTETNSDNQVQSTDTTEISTKTSSLVDKVKSLFGDTTVYADTKNSSNTTTKSTDSTAQENTQSSGDEATDLSSDATLNTDMSDFYLVYAINEKGVVGWYQYDKKESTYQRFVDVTSNQATQEAKYQELSKKYDTLNSSLQNKNSLIKKAIFGIGFAALIILFIIINFIVRIAHLKADIRELEEDDMYQYDDEYYDESYDESYDNELEKEASKGSTNLDISKKEKQKATMPSEESILQAMKDEEMELLNLNQN